MEIKQIFVENGYLYVVNGEDKIIRKYVDGVNFNWEEVELPEEEVKKPEQKNKGNFNVREQS